LDATDYELRHRLATMTDDRIVLHGSFTSSSSYKPMLFLSLSGLPFSFRTVNLKKGVQKEAAHLAINRYGQVPVLQHRGLTLVMSNVILDYLARTTGHFEPKTEQDRIHAREWLSWENDAIMNVARVRHFARFRPDVSQTIVDYFRPPAEAALDFADKSLEGREWLVGDACSIADIGCWGRMVFAHEGGMSIDKRPNLKAWRDRLMAMKGFGLPYDLIPKKDREFD
jgi:glutathione S-transferase